jgi:hypothetical protein
MRTAVLETVEEFKERTLDKLRDVRCPDHKQAPRVSFRGTTLRDVSIQVNACCEKLAALANEKIAVPAATPAAARPWDPRALHRGPVSA